MDIEALLCDAATVREHLLRILIQDTDGKEIARIEATFAIGPQVAQIPAGQMVRAPIAIPLREVPIPAPGLYSFELLVDKQHRRSLPFQAMPAGDRPPFQALLPPQ